MAQVPLERQFAGQARLVRLLLWRVGDSTDVDGCLRVAVESAMLTADDAVFLRECLEAEERQRAHGAGPERRGVFFFCFFSFFFFFFFFFFPGGGGRRAARGG